MTTRICPPARGSGTTRRIAAGVGIAMLLGASATGMAKDYPTIHVVDPHPVNWLWITWNTQEELVRVNSDGDRVPSLGTNWTWIDDRTVEFDLRNAKFQDGEPLTAKVFRRSFDEVQKWDNPHPPGAFLNFAKDTELEVVDDDTIRFTFPEADGAAMMKFRGMHVGSTAFWDAGGYTGDADSAEGQW